MFQRYIASPLAREIKNVRAIEIRGSTRGRSVNANGSAGQWRPISIGDNARDRVVLLRKRAHWQNPHHDRSKC